MSYKEINIIDDMENISNELKPAIYEVWALGYEGDTVVTELLLGTYENPDEAAIYAKDVVLADIVYAADTDWAEDLDYEITHISVEVETVITIETEFCEVPMNVGTIFRNKIDINSADIHLAETDYESLEDGTLKISCEILKDFNKNDKVKILFEEQLGYNLFTYKIISKTMYSDGDYYICNFIY